MTEQDDQHSGSRWELPPGAAPSVPTFDAHQTADADGGPTSFRRLPGRLRRRVITGAAAVALVAAGGVGGFAVGQAASGDDTTVGGTVTDDGTSPDGRPRFDGGATPPDGSSTDGGSTGDGTT